MWRNTEKGGSHKSGEWEIFESKHQKFSSSKNIILFLKLSCFIHTKVEKAKISFAMFLVLQSISTERI